MPGQIEARVELDLTPTTRYRHRPYVAAWITGTAGAHVRTLAFWGDWTKYQRELTKWWGNFSGDRDLVDAVTRATRMAGQYTLEWDGTNQAGAAMPAGEYVFWLEAAYEDGPHSIQSVTVSCGATPVTGLLLNHEDLLPGEAVVETSGTIAPDLLVGPDRLMVVEHLRSDYGAGGAVSSFDVNDNTLFVTLKGPGRTFEAEIDRASGKATIRDTRRGVLDASSILLILASVTGILMWLALPKRRQGGIIALVVSIALLGGVYIWLVP